VGLAAREGGNVDKNAVYRKLKSRILKEEIRAGQWLIEREIATDYGLSRTPVREILQQLTNDGLLIQVPRKGFTVRRVSLEEILDIFQAREAVEGMAARLVCQKGDDEFLNTMRGLKAELENLVVDDDEAGIAGIAIGRRMHDAIFSAVGSGLIAEFYEKLKALVALTTTITRRSVRIESLSRDAHLKIVNAIIERDEEQAEAAMREHIRATCKQIVDTFYPGIMARS